MGKDELEISIPSGVDQNDLWQLEDDLKAIAGEENVRLEEPMDLMAAIGLFLSVGGQAAGYVATGVGIAVTIKETAKKLYGFLHSKDKKDEKDEAARRKMVLKRADGSEVVLYDYSEDDLAQLLTAPDATTEK